MKPYWQNPDAIMYERPPTNTLRVAVAQEIDVLSAPSILLPTIDYVLEERHSPTTGQHFWVWVRR
jgi:uncharacterized membrane protein